MLTRLPLYSNYFLNNKRHKSVSDAIVCVVLGMFSYSCLIYEHLDNLFQTQFNSVSYKRHGILCF